MIQDVDTNIGLLKKQKKTNYERLHYYKGVIDANNAEMEGKNASTKASSSNAANKSRTSTKMGRESAKTMD